MEAGSPPRARGRPARSRPMICSWGLTPACAGTSRPTGGLWRSRRAHPRVRGDVKLGVVLRKSDRGSPPRARGRQPDVDCLRVIPGLTPACAGTSDRVTQVWVCGWAHPRVRGDVRLDPRAAVRRRGLTPACAGTSARVDQAVADAAAHPRVRGDVLARRCLTCDAQGSPPRARGRRPPTRTAAGRRGLTPACAGTSSGRIAKPASSGAHPRVRGDVST